MSLLGQKINEYSVVERKGTCMNVYLGRSDVNKKEVIIKAFLVGLDPVQQKTLDAEIKVGMRISKGCMFLVHHEEVVLKGDMCYLVMEYCSMGDLAMLIADRTKSQKPFSDEEILQLVFQVGKAVEVLHNENVVHRDLKPDNIFITNNGIYKVGDFGISRTIDHSKKKTTLLMASIGYASPEMLDGDSTVSKATDIYALGCILLEAINLRHPFGNENNVVQQSRVFTGRINQPRIGLTSVACAVQDFAVQMVSVNAADRPSISDLLALPVVASFLASQYIIGLNSHEKLSKAIMEKEAMEKEMRKLLEENRSLRQAQAALSPFSFSPPSSSLSHSRTAIIGNASSTSPPLSSPHSPSSPSLHRRTFASASASVSLSAHPHLAPVPRVVSDGYTDLSAGYILNPTANPDIVFYGKRGLDMQFNNTSFQTVFVATAPVGIVELVISVIKRGNRPIGLGAASLGHVSALMAKDIGGLHRGVSSEFNIHKHRWCFCSNGGGRDYVPDRSIDTEEGLRSMEVDTQRKTLRFFKDGKEVAFKFTNVPVDVRMALCGCGGDCAQFVSLRRLSVPVPCSSSSSSVPESEPCATEGDWNKDYDTGV